MIITCEFTYFQLVTQLRFCQVELGWLRKDATLRLISQAVPTRQDSAGYIFYFEQPLLLCLLLIFINKMPLKKTIFDYICSSKAFHLNRVPPIRLRGILSIHDWHTAGSSNPHESESLVWTRVGFTELTRTYKNKDKCLKQIELFWASPPPHTHTHTSNQSIIQFYLQCVKRLQVAVKKHNLVLPCVVPALKQDIVWTDPGQPLSSRKLKICPLLENWVN